jgi:maltose-binding protein MalE
MTDRQRHDIRVSRPPGRPRTLAVSLLSVLALILAACGGGAEEGGDGEPVAATRGDADLVIWADPERAPYLQGFADEFGAANGVSVAVQQVPGANLRSQLQTAGPAGQGPDVVIGPHDWIGELSVNGVIAPVDLGGREDEFLDIAVDAFTVNDQVFGLPIAVEAIALYRNTDLVPEAPATWEEVEETALRLQEEGVVEQGLVIPAGPEEMPYFNQPLLTAYGGYVFERTEEGYDTDDVGLDNPGALEAAEAFRRWVDEGLINPNITGDLMQEFFGNGQAAFAISGPWSLVQGGRGFEETGVPFEVTPIPPVEGGTPQPFVGVQGFMVSAFAENPLLAQTFLLEVAATPQAQVALAEQLARAPALQEAYDEFVEENPVYEAFGESAEQGRPMPAIPEMASVFAAMTQAYVLIYQNAEGTPESQFRNAADQVRQAVEGP